MVNDDIFQQVESREAKVRVNQAAGFRAAKKLVRQDPAFIALRDAVENADDVARVADRAIALSTRAVDPRYESPYDIAFLMYLLVLEDVLPILSRYVASHLLRSPNLTWADAESHKLLSQEPQVNRETGEDTTRSDQVHLSFSEDRYEIGEQRIFNPLGPRLIRRIVETELDQTIQQVSGQQQTESFEGVRDLLVLSRTSGQSEPRLPS